MKAIDRNGYATAMSCSNRTIVPGFFVPAQLFEQDLAAFDKALHEGFQYFDSNLRIIQSRVLYANFIIFAQPEMPLAKFQAGKIAGTLKLLDITDLQFEPLARIPLSEALEKLEGSGIFFH